MAHITPPYSSGSGGFSPWKIDIEVFEGSASNVNFNTIAADAGLSCYGGYLLNSGAQNDEVVFSVVIPGGTWTLELMYAQGANIGIYTITIDGASLTSLSGSADTIDGYAAGVTRNVTTAITGIVLAANTTARALKLKMATKNASSSNYYGQLQHIQLRRTA